MDDGRQHERGEHAEIELLRRDDALELTAGGGERGVVVPGRRDDLVDQPSRRVEITPDEMGLERRRQHPIAVGRSLIQAGDARRDKIENLPGEPARRRGVAGEQRQGRGIDRRVIRLGVAGVGGGAEGVLIKCAALAEQRGARLARLTRTPGPSSAGRAGCGRRSRDSDRGRIRNTFPAQARSRRHWRGSAPPVG